jgi:hypothetical protein
MTWSLSQNCTTLSSGIRARTGRVGLLQSEAKIGSQTTSTVRLPDLSCFNTSSAAEAPRKQPGHVGDKSSTIRALAAAWLNSSTNCPALSALRRVSGGWPLGVLADHKKCQPSASATHTPASNGMYLFFTIPTCPESASYQAGDHLRKQHHQEQDHNRGPEKNQTRRAASAAGRFPKVELHQPHA